MHIELQSCTTTDTTDNLKSVCRTKLDPAQAAEKTPPACAPALHSKVHCLMLYKQTHAHGDTMPLVFVHGCVRLSTPHNVLLHEPTFFHSDLSYQRTTSISRVVVHAHKQEQMRASGCRARVLQQHMYTQEQSFGSTGCSGGPHDIVRHLNKDIRHRPAPPSSHVRTQPQQLNPSTRTAELQRNRTYTICNTAVTAEVHTV